MPLATDTEPPTPALPHGTSDGSPAAEPVVPEPVDTAAFHPPEPRTGTPRWPESIGALEDLPYDYERFGQLTGPLTQPVGSEQRVRFRRPPGTRPRRKLVGAFTVLVIQSSFLIWLLSPGHLPTLGHSVILSAGSVVMIGSIYLIELFRFINLSSLCMASTLARDPIPMAATPGTRVAFLTSIVPSREPLPVVRTTLEAARRVRHVGELDVWLLDEEDDTLVRAVCDEIGVKHFSRRGIERYNRSSGPFKARTKHGNYNAWVDAHGDDYEFFVSVDPDHVPLESFCERLLGYFRDPDVAFVVGPQVYGNYDNVVTKCAESQQFVFHGLIQRLGNFFGCPMLVGTNNAVRIAALRQIGGMRDSITEDLATSLSCHSSVNPASGRRWRSVYTPDVLAVGEGPSDFTDFFTQQHRWSRGTFDNFRGHLWRSMRTLGWGPRFHYALITSYYPSAAIGWILGALNCTIYLVLGATGLRVNPHVWFAVYADLAAVQFCLYASNRKLNVSPHELPGSSGAAGMFISVLAAPIYVVALVGTLMRRSHGFVVTPKGDFRSADKLSAFRWHLAWGGLLATALAVSMWLNRPQSSMRLWSLILICVCLAPWAISVADRYRAQRRQSQPRRARARRSRRPAAVSSPDAAMDMSRTEAA